MVAMGFGVVEAPVWGKIIEFSPILYFYSSRTLWYTEGIMKCTLLATVAADIHGSKG